MEYGNRLKTNESTRGKKERKNKEARHTGAEKVTRCFHYTPSVLNSEINIHSHIRTVVNTCVYA